MLTYQQAKDIEDALGHQQAAPIINALQELDQKIERQRTAVKQDLLLELATKADIADLRTEIGDIRAELKTDMASLRTELKIDMANLSAELKTDMANLRTELKDDIGKLRTELKDDIGKLRTDLTANITFLNGKIETEIAKITGELKSIRLWMKLLVAIGILGMTLFSPAAVKLLEMLK